MKKNYNTGSLATDPVRLRSEADFFPKDLLPILMAPPCQKLSNIYLTLFE